VALIAILLELLRALALCGIYSDWGLRDRRRGLRGYDVLSWRWFYATREHGQRPEAERSKPQGEMCTIKRLTSDIGKQRLIVNGKDEDSRSSCARLARGR
jgi:hypothetical protein